MLLMTQRLAMILIPTTRARATI